MDNEQADEIVELLRDILSELRDMKTSFDEFTGYNTMKMSEAVDGIADRITDGVGDVVRALQSVESAVELK